ncbi:MAG: DUF2807 domain-containing protein [Pseudomonadota bacterium]
MFRCLLYLSLIILLISGCGGGEDTTTTRDPTQPAQTTTLDFKFDGIDEISVAGPFEVILTMGDQGAATFTLDSHLVDSLQIEEVDNRVEIGLDAQGSIQATTLRLDMTLPEMRELQLSGATFATFSGFQGDHLTLRIRGAVFVEGLDSAYTTLDIEAVGASAALLSDLQPLAYSQVNLEGASTTTVPMMDFGTIQGNLVGASALIYRGNQVDLQVTTDLSSAVVQEGS